MCGRCVECYQPWVALIQWTGTGEGPYFMCDFCAWHSVKNRGGTIVGVGADHSKDYGFPTILRRAMERQKGL